MTNLPFKKIVVDQFRGLNELELDGFGSINLLVGENNSGKSSVIEALSLLTSPYDSSEWARVVQRRDYGGLDESRALSLRWCFNKNLFKEIDAFEDIALSCEFRVEGDFPLRSMTAQYAERTQPIDSIFSKSQLDFYRNYPDVYTERLFADGGGSLRVAEIKNRLEWDSAIKSEEKFPVVSKAYKTDHNGLAGRILKRSGVVNSKYGVPRAILLPYSYQLNNLQVTGRSKQLNLEHDEFFIDLIKQFDPDVLNVEIASFQGIRPAIYVKHRKLGVAPLSIFGDALRRCLLLATTITQLEAGGVLLLDEVEVGIHVKRLPELFRWLASVAKQMGVQVFATTHSLEVLDAFLGSKVSPSDIVTYHLYQDQDQDKTKNKRFSGEDLHLLRDRGFDVR